MRNRRLAALLIVIAAAIAASYVVAPYARAASLIVRAAKLGGRVEAFARSLAHLTLGEEEEGHERAIAPAVVQRDVSIFGRDAR